MATTPAAPVQPVRLDPSLGSSPALSTNPFDQFPLAEAPAWMGREITEKEAREGYVQPPPAPTEPAVNPFDQFAKAEEEPAPAVNEFDRFSKAGEMVGYDMGKLKATPLEVLMKDKHEFNPVDFYARNTDALLADPESLEKVEKVFEERDKERLTPGGLIKGIVTAPLHPIESAKKVGKAVKGGVEFLGALKDAAGQIIEGGFQAAGHASAGDLPAVAGKGAELIAAIDIAAERWPTIVADKLAPALGILPRGKTAREKLAYDADFRRAEIRAGEGNGNLAWALGTAADDLKASGVELDKNAIDKMSVLTDPFFVVPVGQVVGVAGRAGKFILGKATSPAAAEAFAKAVNGAMEKAAAYPVAKAGQALDVGGKALEAQAPRLVAQTTGLRGAGIVASAMSGNVAPLAAMLAAPSAAKFGGQAIAATGRAIEAGAPAFGRVATEFGKGAAEGAVIAMPLMLGANEEEQEAMLGMIAGGAMLRGGLAGAGIAKAGLERAERRAAMQGQNKLAKQIFEAVDRGEVKPSQAYGTDTKLDAAHDAHSGSLPRGEQSVLSHFREFFRDSGIEIYGLDKDTFRNNVPNVAGAEAAEGFFLKKGEKLNPDGTRSPVVQILLNKDTNGLGHELYHAFKSLDPQGATALEAHIAKTWTPKERAWLSDTYNSALNGGKPRSQWTVELNEKQILEEAASEVFGRVINATDLTGVRPSITKRAATFASTVLEKMGYPLAGKALPAGPGVSALGVRPSTAELKVSQDFLGDMTKRVKEGTLGPPQPAKPLEAGSPAAISRRSEPTPPPTPSETPAAPATPTPATPPPLPAAPAAAVPPAPATPVPTAPPAPAAPAAENIRVTPAEQADFAAARAQETNAPQAAQAAVKAGKVPEVEAINQSMVDGHAVEVVHKGVIREGGPTPEKPVGREVRRAEQEEAYVAEAMGAVPDSVREPHQKVFFGTRWVEGGKKLIARSLDKALANIKNVADMATAAKVALPYEVDAAGKLTEAGWHEAVTDLKDYWSNQDRGFRGDGQALTPETRTKDIGQSIPAEDPRGPAALISTERTDFLNLVQGLNIPETVARQKAGKLPGNVKGQLLAEMQGKKPAKPAGFTEADVQRKTYKPIEGVGVRSIMEVNPLRNDLRAAGAPVSKLIEVTELIKLENIESVTPRPDVAGKGGSTDITRAGFSVKSVEDAKRVIDQSPSDWVETVKTFKGGLTPEAYRLGLGLKDAKDLATLRELRDVAEKQGRDMMAAGDFDGAMPTIMKAQFFREAIEAATGTGSAKTGMKLVKEFADAKPPLAPEGSFSPRTAKGQEFAEKGYDFFIDGDEGDRSIYVTKDGLPIGTTSSKSLGKNRAEISMTQLSRDERGKGLGEAMYRELFSVLQSDGVELVEGMAVSPEPVALRKKIFGEFEKLEGGGEPISVEDALASLSELRKPPGARKMPLIGAVDVANRITPDQKFSAAPAEAPKDYDVVWKPRKEGKVTFRQKVKATSAEDATAKLVPKGAHVVSAEPTFKVEKPIGQMVEEAGAPVGIRPLTREERGLPPLPAEEKFSPALAGAEPSKASQEKAAAAWKELGTESPFFKKWFGKSEVVDPYRPSDPQVVYHGTTHEFTQFDMKNANPENDFGKGFYFSSEPREVGKNYAGEGPDLTLRLEEKMSEILDNTDEVLSREEAMDRARAELKGTHEGAIMPAYLSIKKPFRVGNDVSGARETFLETNERGTGTLDKFFTNLERIANDYDGTDAMAGIAEVREAVGYDSTTARELVKAIRESEHFTYASDPMTGDLAVSQMIRETIEASGFDGIIDETVAMKFKNMMEQPDTIHYIAFKPEQIKSATGNVGTFRATNPDIRFSAGRKVPTDKEVTAALSSDKQEFVGAHRDLEPGTPVGLRIDIPAFTRNGTYVVTVHEKAKGGSVGKRIGYDGVATVDNPTFFSNERGAEKIREGAAKFPVATVEGEFNPSRTVPKAGGEWTEVGYNPVKHSYFYEKGTEKPVVSGDQAVSAGNSVFVKNAEFGNKEDFAFSPKAPKEAPLTPETAEAAVEKFNKVRATLFPEAKPQRYVRDAEGKLELDKKGKLIPADEEARLHETPLAKEALKDMPDVDPHSEEGHEAIAEKLSERIVAEANEALKNPDAKKGLTWYDDAVELIQKYYPGEHGEKFAQLLAATSPRNGVQVNFAYAVEAFNNFMEGKYDRNVKEYLGLREQWKTGEGKDLAEWQETTGKKWREGTGEKAKSLRNSFLNWSVEKHNLLPLREGKMVKGELTATLYGMHTFAVLDVLADTWLQDVEGPKVRNFLANLTGKGHEATIDIWATRFLMRLAQDETSLKGQWRVAPPAGEGISNENFALAQRAFRKAAEKMGSKADALQALVWFSEKHLWEENNWTGFVGAAKSDYAYWLRGLEPGEKPGTQNIPERLREEAKAQGAVERAKAEEARQARAKLLSGAGLEPVVE